MWYHTTITTIGENNGPYTQTNARLEYHMGRADQPWFTACRELGKPLEPQQTTTPLTSGLQTKCMSSTKEANLLYPCCALPISPHSKPTGLPQLCPPGDLIL